MILAAVLWGYLGNREQGSRRWRILNAAVFAGIAAVIFYMTVCARGEGTAEAVLVPFQSFREAREQPELYRSMLMNVLLFSPSGCPCHSCWGNGSCPSPSRSCWRAFFGGNRIFAVPLQSGKMRGGRRHHEHAGSAAGLLGPVDIPQLEKEIDRPRFLENPFGENGFPPSTYLDF